MDEGAFRRQAVQNQRGDRPSRVHGRPDRVALWAVFMSLAAVAAAALSAAGASAQSGTGGTTMLGECQDARFGDRWLKLGDCGDDVRTLNWVLRSKSYATGVGLSEDFDDSTDSAVREFQSRAGVASSGVVDDATRQELKGSMKRRISSWYGPGFWGNRTACGRTLKHETVGVAHRKLPCGTKVTFYKRGRWLRTKVIDRGPYVSGRTWDLTGAAAEALGMQYTGSLRSAVTKQGDRMPRFRSAQLAG
jgi:peptidoglycan hydrolase-like protein with peptidoglycan-binding domain